MKTDDLITALAADSLAEPPLTDGLALRLALALAVCVAVVGVVLGFREELGSVLLVPLSALRFVLTLSLFGAGLQMALVLGRPEGAGLLRYGPLTTIALLAGVALVWALATTPPGGWPMAVRGKTLAWCLTMIPLLSVVPVTVLLLTLRRGATTRPRLAGAMAGLAGSAGATAAYALHCTEDSPLFYVTWYGFAIAGVTLGASVIGGRMLR